MLANVCEMDGGGAVEVRDGCVEFLTPKCGRRTSRADYGERETCDRDLSEPDMSDDDDDLDSPF